MKLSVQVARNTIVQTLGKTVSTILGLFILAVVARYLGQFGFGQYTTIITYLTFFATLADFGLTLVTVQFISQREEREDEILNNLFGFRLVSAALLLLAGVGLAVFSPYGHTIKMGIAISSVSFLFIALNQVFVGLFQKKLSMQYVAMAELFSRIVLFVFVYIVWNLDWGLLGILAATILSSAVSFLVHFFYSRQFVKIKFEFNKELWKKIVLKSWPLAVTIFFNLIYLKTDTLILSLVKTQNEVGIYGAAYRVIDVLITIPFMFAGLLLPILTANWAQGNKDFFFKVMQKAFDVMSFVAMPFLAGSLMVSKDLMRIVAGDEFIASGVVLPILILASVFIYLGVIFSHAVIALDKQKRIIPAYMLVAVTSLAGYFIFIPKYSYFGAAWMTVYSEFTIAIASFYIVKKYSGFLPRLSVFFKSIIASLIMLIALYSMQSALNTAWIIFLGAVIYFAGLFALRAIRKEEIIDLLNFKK